MSRSTKAEVNSRVREVFKLRLGGAECSDICDFARAQEPPWDVCEAQIRRYIQAADALCREYFDAKAEHLLARHLLQRRQLYAHAMSAGDFRTALAVLESEARLEGLDPLVKLKIKEAEELERRLTELEQRIDTKSSRK